MTDEEENFAEEVSELLHKSCQQRLPTFFEPTQHLRGRSFDATHPINGTKCKVFPVVTGSKAEFYINPILTCIGDVDVMYYYSNELAIPSGHPPPRELPAHFDRCVKVFEIEDSHIPGYVYLNFVYMLSKRTDNGKYEISEYAKKRRYALSHVLYVTAGVTRDDAEIHGPACASRESFHQRAEKFEWDTVPCIRCMVWPTQAADWPTRHRNYEWPNQETVDRVIRKGCDVVGVAHNLCKQDEWMNKHQWRMSFSRAEVVLLNSWIPEQQMVYHMLRMFLKTGLLTNSDDYSDKCTLSNYHIKTMMMWACELKPKRWWTGGATLVSLCLQLLQFFDDWLTKMHGKHYFINNVYFFYYFDPFSVDTITAVIKSTTEGSLTRWFVDNYIRKCAERCPDNCTLMCSDVMTNEVLRGAVPRILKWRDHIFIKDGLKHVLNSAMLSAGVSRFRSWGQRLLEWLFSTSRPLFRAVFASGLEYARQFGDTAVSSFMCLIVDIINCVDVTPFRKQMIDHMASMSRMRLMRFKGERRQFQLMFSSQGSDTTRLPKFVVWLNVIANKHPDNHHPIHIEIAKEYLLRALISVDSKSSSIFGLANVYMAVLCYITGQYERATDHCTLVTRSLTHTQCCSQVVDGQLLPKIDDNINTVLGLAALYLHVRSATLRQQQFSQHTSVFNTKLFAHYLNIRHLIVADCRLVPKTQEKHVLQAAEFYASEELELLFNTLVSISRLSISDLMLCKVSNISCQPGICSSVSATITNSDHGNKQQLVQLLTEPSIEQLLSCRQSLSSKDTEFTAAMKPSDFLPLRLYRCKLYERCKQLCQPTVFETFRCPMGRLSHLSFVYHEFVRLMDDNMVSLIGTAVLVNRSKAQCMFSEPVIISQLTLLLYLLTQCQKKLLFSDWSKLFKSDISSLADVLDLIGKAQDLIPSSDVLDQLILKLAERLAVIHITDTINFQWRRRSHTYR